MFISNTLKNIKDETRDANNNEKAKPRETLPPLPQQQQQQALIVSEDSGEEGKQEEDLKGKEEELPKKEEGKKSSGENSASGSGFGTSTLSTIASASNGVSSGPSLPAAVASNTGSATNGSVIPANGPRRCKGPGGCGTPPPLPPPSVGVPPRSGGSPPGSLGSLASAPLSVRGLSSAMQPAPDAVVATPMASASAPAPAPSPVKKAKRRCPVHGTPPRSAASSRTGSGAKGSADVTRRPSTAPSMPDAQAPLTAGQAASPSLPPATQQGLRLPIEMPPLGTVSANFWMARKLHDDNLKHSPLPDAVRPGMALTALALARPDRTAEATDGPTAVALRGRAGPTQVAKARVHRPRTAGVLAVPHVESSEAPAMLAAAGVSAAGGGGSSSGDRAGRPRYRRPVRPVDLAICWDLRPESPSAEPHPPTHLDGSNGSKAPAVFALVAPVPDQQPSPADASHTHATGQEGHPVATNTSPQPPAQVTGPCGGPGGCGTPVACSNSSSSRRKHRTAWPENNVSSITCSQHSLLQGSSRGSRNDKENLPPGSKSGGGDGDKSANNGSNGNRSNHRASNGGSSSRSRRAQRRSGSAGTNFLPPNATRSPPALSSKVGSAGAAVGSPGNGALRPGNSLHRSSPCVSAPNSPPLPPPPPPLDLEKAVLVRPKSDYKMAFKAGTLSSGAGRVVGGGSPGVRVPKPRAPFVRRSYSIDTLAPPFSLWPGDSGHAYPEHWRLASVYQHAYKPVERRRRPLLASVYQ